jgi:peptidoglycan/xylan/chitin deacetylase (PgdA/CDA1 family)
MNNKLFSNIKAITACSIAFGLAGFSMAAPIKTIPWNGHVGAVSFTFDDALENQVQNLKPVLDELPDVHVTFFLTDMGNGLKQNAAGFAALAKAGHEIGNHAKNHGHLSGITNNEELNEEIVKFADNIEKVLADQGVSTNVISFATPFCENNDQVKGVIDTRHFINRDCGWHGRNEWDVEPDWLALKAKIWTRSGASVPEMLTAMDTAAFIGNFAGAEPWEVQIKGGTWLVVLNHGVTDDKGDDYAIDPADIKKIFERAIEDKLWVAPFGTIGAYYRAHFIVDAATSAATDDGFTVSWKIPHEHMPKSIPLRVNIDTKSVGENVVVEQDGQKITPESDGSYIIEFMSKSLTVRKAGAGDSTTHPQDTTATPPTDSTKDTSTALPKIQLGNVQNSTIYTKFTLFDLNGNRIGTVRDFTVPENYPKGTYIIRAEAKGQAAITKKVSR